MLRINVILELLLYSAALLGYLPLAPHLQRLPAIAVPAALLFAVIASRRRFALRDKPALFVSIGFFAYYLLQFNRHNVVAPAANMLAIFLAIRLAGEKSPRHFLQTVTLALFCLAASTLFELGPGFIVYLTLLVLIITISLVLLAFQSCAPEFDPGFSELRSLLRIALLQPLLAFPLAVLLFFILPRTQFPLWQGLTNVGSDNPGISDTVQPGDKGSISSGGGVVFRAEMPQQPPGTLYWRVIVLNSLKENSWVRRQPPANELPTVKGGTSVSQTIFLDPGKLPFLPALDLPSNIKGFRGQPTSDQLFVSYGLFNRRRNYEAGSQAGGYLDTAGRINKGFYTTLPDNIPPRLRNLALGAASPGGSSQQRLDRLEKAFLGLNLSYASSDLPTGPAALDTFLFTAKKGHCELFATSFALALRLAGVPSRLVGGYYGGDYNELAGYYVITAERAHIWVEVWLEGSGWVTVDPSRFAANFAETAARKSSSSRLKLTLFLDTLTYYWNRMVITYDLESQFNAISSSARWLRNFNFSLPPLRLVALGAALLAAASGLGFILFRKRRSTEELLLRRFTKTVKARFGIVLSPAAGLHESLHGVDDAAVREFIAIYTGAVYRDRQLNAEEAARLRSLLTKIGRDNPHQKK
jgi:hypothetical protein